MKRTKFIVGAMVLSMGLLGTGYAYWTDSLSVGATVSTGKFNVNFQGTEIEEWISTTDGFVEDTDNLIESSSETNNEKNEMTFIANNMFPGSQVEFSYNVQNESTIPMVLDEVKVNGEGTDVKGFEVMLWDQNSDNTIEGKGDTLGEKLEDAFGRMYETINPGDYADPTSHELSIIAVEDAMINQEEKIQLTISTTWRQENAPGK